MAAPQIKVSARELRKHAQREMRRLTGQRSADRPPYVTVLVDETTGKPIGVATSAEAARKHFGDAGETVDFELKVL